VLPEGRPEGVGGRAKRERETAAVDRDGTMLETKLDLIAKRARGEPSLKFNSLAHLLNEAFLAECYGMLKKGKAPGVDGVSVEAYGEGLEGKLKELVERMKAKRYRPQPVRRVFIPKRLCQNHGCKFTEHLGTLLVHQQVP
jgi:hypothetical protein